MTRSHPDLDALVLRLFRNQLGPLTDSETGFFDAGGDSLSAEALLTALSTELGLDLPGWLLLDHPSSRSLAAALADILPPG